MRAIAVINQKGGVGKTTTCINLAHALAQQGHRTLVLDLDPQSHVAASLGITSGQERGMDAVLLEGVALDEVVLAARERLSIVPAGLRVREVEQLVSGGVERGRRLEQALAALTMPVDFLFIDCPPSSGLLAVNALFAAQEVLVPMPGDYLALHGLSQLLRVLKSVERMQQRQTQLWVALTRAYPRRWLTREVLKKLLHYFPEQVLATSVREISALAEAPSFGQSIFEYRPSCHGAEDYAQLAVDLIERRTMQWQTIENA